MLGIIVFEKKLKRFAATKFFSYARIRKKNGDVVNNKLVWKRNWGIHGEFYYLWEKVALFRVNI